MLIKTPYFQLLLILVIFLVIFLFYPRSFILGVLVIFLFYPRNFKLNFVSVKENGKQCSEIFSKLFFSQANLLPWFRSMVSRAPSYEFLDNSSEFKASVKYTASSCYVLENSFYHCKPIFYSVETVLSFVFMILGHLM